MNIKLLLNLVVLLCALLLPISSFSAETELTLSSIRFSSVHGRALNQRLTLIITEAFQRMNIKVHFVTRPPKRSLMDANRGVVDGDFVRISGLSKVYENLVEVPESIHQVNFVAFVNEQDVRIKQQGEFQWNDLSTFRVATLLGWEEVIERIKNFPHKILLRKEESLFKTLKAGRIDVAIFADQAGYSTLRKLKMTGIIALAPPLSTKKMHIYLHKKHLALIPELNESIKSMKIDGTYQRLYLNPEAQ